MDEKVRRGLGLLAVAGLGLIALVAGQSLEVEMMALLGLLALGVGLVGGLVNIAAGLLARP